MSAFLTRVDGRLQYQLPGLRSGESSSQGSSDARFANASPTLRQRFAQPREPVAPSARSGQYRSPTVSDESKVETDTITPSTRSAQYCSPTVSEESYVEIDTITESEVETDTITPSARSGQYRSTTVSDELLRNFQRALAKNKMTECPRCHIRWFTITPDRRIGICKKYMKDNAFRRRTPPLIPLEEWLIARVHTRMQVEDLIAKIENDDLGYDVSVIADLGADETELDRLCGILRRGQGEPNPSSDIAFATGPQGLQLLAIPSTPISDIGVKTRILSLAYPSLCPWGKGDFAASRQRTVDFKPYVQHMLRLSHAANRSSYFFKKNNSVRLTVQEFRDAINSNGPQSKSLINRIICFSSTITGTRAF
ncbi:hypothetical protein E4U19_000859 [Claviceps sp. Clav32 group G5]|nr:hypothetical protein E4U19_000859 [Claviceps sp. Clav32 group G5]